MLAAPERGQALQDPRGHQGDEGIQREGRGGARVGGSSLGGPGLDELTMCMHHHSCVCVCVCVCFTTCN